jgi:hypothetical protein
VSRCSRRTDEVSGCNPQVIITSLIIYFSGKGPLTLLTYLAIFALVTYATLSPILTPVSALRALVTASIPLSLSSKVPQIITNQRAGSTGQLSAFLVFNSLAGCLARLFTTQTETGDRALWWMFASASALNAVLAVQMIVFWKKSQQQQGEEYLLKKRGDERLRSRGAGAGEKETVVIETTGAAARRSPVPGVTAARPKSPQQQQKANPQRWTRKLD